MVRRAHQHELNDEIELPQRRRGVGRLHDLAFQEEHHVVDELERDLPVDPQHRSVDVDPLARRARDTSASFMQRVSDQAVDLDELVTSFDLSCRMRSASLMIHRPIEMRSARSFSGRPFSGCARSSMKNVHSRRM